uniref:YbjN domain-containing protein n=1 Tax=Roseihalotalea indica TaxID=2867963 RepID=A0AA49JIC5_9BACT|nr:hypothetical protein K4G66_18375 [Tunicatimonas sp. TK19036]
MDLLQFLQNLAEELEGSFSEYDEHTSVIVVPMKDGRFQSVQGKIHSLDDQDTKMITFTSKVCPYYHQMDLVDFMTENKKMIFSKFTVDNTFIKTEASVFLEFVSDHNKNFLKDMIHEVAEMADKWEHKLTGLDVF